jgi:ribonuclease HII
LRSNRSVFLATGSYFFQIQPFFGQFFSMPKRKRQTKGRRRTKGPAPALDVVPPGSAEAGELVIGVDEVGRGPLIGPVTVCAVHLRHTEPEAKDSKKWKTERQIRQRDALVQRWTTTGGHHHLHALAWRTAEQINESNILRATMSAAVEAVLAVRRAIADAKQPQSQPQTATSAAEPGNPTEAAPQAQTATSAAEPGNPAEAAPQAQTATSAAEPGNPTEAAPQAQTATSAAEPGNPAEAAPQAQTATSAAEPGNPAEAAPQAQTATSAAESGNPAEAAPQAQAEEIAAESAPQAEAEEIAAESAPQAEAEKVEAEEADGDAAESAPQAEAEEVEGDAAAESGVVVSAAESEGDAADAGPYAEGDATAARVGELGGVVVRVLVDGDNLPSADEVAQIAPNGELDDVIWETVVGGDNKYQPIAAASMIAKQARDAHVLRMSAAIDPGGRYHLAENKGYGSAKHLRAIVEHGPLADHRAVFISKWRALHEQYIALPDDQRAAFLDHYAPASWAKPKSQPQPSDGDPWSEHADADAVAVEDGDHGLRAVDQQDPGDEHTPSSDRDPSAGVRDPGAAVDDLRAVGLSAVKPDPSGDGGRDPTDDAERSPKRIKVQPETQLLKSVAPAPAKQVDSIPVKQELVG